MKKSLMTYRQLLYQVDHDDPEAMLIAVLTSALSTLTGKSFKEIYASFRGGVKRTLEDNAHEVRDWKHHDERKDKHVTFEGLRGSESD